MPEHTINFEVKAANTIELPNRRYAAGRYRVHTEPDGSVDIFGNREGLLYLAEILVRCALGGHTSGCHVHLPRRGVAAKPDVSGEPELTVYSASTDVDG